MFQFICHICSILKRVDVVDAGDTSSYSYKHLGVFYTGLFRALTFPRRIDEIDEQGRYLCHSWRLILSLLLLVLPL